jgi:hypothetical protein
MTTEGFNSARFLYALLQIFKEMMENPEDPDLAERAQTLHESLPLEEVINALSVGHQAMWVFMERLRANLPEDLGTRKKLSSHAVWMFTHLLPVLFWTMKSVGGVTDEFFDQALLDLADSSTVEEFIAATRR